VATVDRHGYVRIVDRTKDLVKSGGEWISSVELENAIMDHPDVAEAAVIGVAHATWSERPVAYVVANPGATPTAETVRDHLRTRVASWWLPDQVFFLDEIPQTATGKFSKQRLRSLYNADNQPPSPHSPAPST
jgi:fatty-acyl-CoA synthase